MSARRVMYEMPTKTAEELPGYDRWKTQSPYENDPEPCPNCGGEVGPHDEQCPHCGHYVGDHEPDPDSQYGGHDNPIDHYDGGWGHEYSKTITAKFHILADGPEVPAEQPGEVDHTRVDQMSQSQQGAHQNEVNYAINMLNKVISEGGTVDDSLLENIKMNLVNEFGMHPQEAQTVVDQAMRQSTNQDGTQDTLAPPPPDQAAAPEATPAQAVGQGPEPVPLANGAFAKTARGTVGEVTDTWEDMYGEKWVEVTGIDGRRESVYADEVERLTARTASASESAVSEIRTFLKDTEPSSITTSEVKARIANLKLAAQEIRRLVANRKVSDQAAAELDNVQRDVEVELLNLTDTLPGLGPTFEQPVEAIFDTADHIHPSLYGMDEISVLDDTPAIPEDAIEAAIPEEAEVFASDNAGKPEAALLSMAASYIDQYTAGHPAQVRAHHRDRFVAAVKKAAVTSTDEPDTHTASEEDEPIANYDGPAEAIFLS